MCKDCLSTCLPYSPVKVDGRESCLGDHFVWMRGACSCETLSLPVEVMVGYASTPDGVNKKKQELRACLGDGIADAIIAE